MQKSNRRLLVISFCLGAVVCLFAPVRSSGQGESSLAVRQIEVTLEEGTDFAAALSPDGRIIAIDLQGTIWQLPAAGGTAKASTDAMGDARQPAFSPDGKRIAFQSYRDGNWHLWTVSAEGTDLRQLTFGPFDDREPHWSSDGSKITFSSDREGTYDLWELELETGRLDRLTTGAGNEFAPAWSPDDQRIAFVSEQDLVVVPSIPGSRDSGDGISETARSVRVLFRDGKQRTVTTVTGNASAPSWSPDGTMLLFNEIEGLESRLLLVDVTESGSLSSSNKPRLVTLPDEDVFPFRASWLSPTEFLYTADGKIKRRSLDLSDPETVAFKATVTLERHTYERRRRDFDSTDPQPVLGIVTPAVSPDGSHIAFVALGDLWLLTIGGEPERLTEDGFVELHPAWSSDGERLVYACDRAGTMDLWIKNLRTGEDRQLTDRPGAETYPAWSPDNSLVVFSDGRGALELVDVVSGEVVDLHAPLMSESNCCSPASGRATWSSDGTVVAVSALNRYSSRFREGRNDILLISRHGSPDRRVTPFSHRSIGSRGTDGPVWSPDGSMMAFTSDGALWVVPVGKAGEPIGPPRRFANELAEAISWTGDSRAIFFMAVDRLQRVSLDDGRVETVPLELTWRQKLPTDRLVVHAGRLFDGRSDSLRRDMDIIIMGHRIREITPHRSDLHSGRVVDSGQGTVIPGLIDMHVHQQAGFGEVLGRIWLSYGITSVREPLSNPYEARERLESISSGKRVGPREFFTGQSFDGSRTYYAGALAMDAGAQLEAELDRARKLEYDFIKTYVRLSDPVQKRIVERAHEMGIPVTSHELYPAAAYGTDGIEHYRGTSRRGYSPKATWTFRTYQDVIEILARSGMATTPTMGVFSFPLAAVREPALIEDRRLDLFPSPVIESIRAAMERARKDRASEENRLERLGRIVKDYSEAGVRILGGTDIHPYAVSLHAELQHFVEEAGLSPLRALQTVSLHAAESLGAAEDLGSIEAGKLADIVIVDGNPLEEIRDARRVRTVIQNGQVYELEDLLKRP